MLTSKMNLWVFFSFSYFFLVFVFIMGDWIEGGWDAGKEVEMGCCWEGF